MKNHQFFTIIWSWDYTNTYTEFQPTVLNICLKNHEIAPSDVTAVKPPQNLKGAIGKCFSQILRRNEGAGIKVGQIDNVYAARPAHHIGERVFRIAGHDFHPGRAIKDSIPIGIGLRKEFGHSIFAVYFGYTKTFF